MLLPVPSILDSLTPTEQHEDVQVEVSVDALQVGVHNILVTGEESSVVQSVMSISEEDAVTNHNHRRTPSRSDSREQPEALRSIKKKNSRGFSRGGGSKLGKSLRKKLSREGSRVVEEEEEEVIKVLGTSPRNRMADSVRNMSPITNRSSALEGTRGAGRGGGSGGTATGGGATGEQRGRSAVPTQGGVRRRGNSCPARQKYPPRNMRMLHPYALNRQDTPQVRELDVPRTTEARNFARNQLMLKLATDMRREMSCPPACGYRGGAIGFSKSMDSWIQPEMFGRQSHPQQAAQPEFLSSLRKPNRVSASHKKSSSSRQRRSIRSSLGLQRKVNPQSS